VQIKTVLIISQDENAIEDIKQAFYVCMPDISVEVMRSAIKTLEISNLSNIECVLLDLNGQIEDGFEVLTMIRKRITAPFITMSYSRDRSLLVKALTLEADNHITKPFNQLELISIVRACLRRSQQDFGSLRNKY
jgi:DNA-binding response OmpR family regulator